MDFRSGNDFREEKIQLTNPTISKLEITSESPDQNFYRNRWFKIEPFDGFDGDTAMIKNVSVHIFKSNSDSFKVTMLKLVNGYTTQEANRTASEIKFNINQRDSLLITDEGIPITRNEKFRNQEIVLMVYVPVGKRIRVADNFGWGGHMSFGPSNDWKLGFRGQEEGWDHDKDYEMRADGLYDLNGVPAARWKHPEWRDDASDDWGDDANDDRRRNNRTESNGSGYRYDKPATPETDSSLKQKAQQEQQQQKEQKAKDSIKAGDKVSTDLFNQTMSYTLPAYNPLLIMN